MLKLKRGLRWKGRLEVRQKLEDGRYVIAFNAEEAKKKPGSVEHFIFDITTFTRQQVMDWTGVDIEAKKKDGR